MVIFIFCLINLFSIHINSPLKVIIYPNSVLNFYFLIQNEFLEVLLCCFTKPLKEAILYNFHLSLLLSFLF